MTRGRLTELEYVFLSSAKRISQSLDIRWFLTVLIPFSFRQLKMVDSTSKDQAITTPRPTGEVSKLYDAVNENLVNTVDELAKVQPHYGQSIHNTILAQIHTIKNVIHNTILAQKQLASGWNHTQNNL
jgi:hypothetical protein